MKKSIKFSVFSILIAAVLFLAAMPLAYAEKAPATQEKLSEVPAVVAAKEEVIYADLDSAGKTNKIYAVNILNVEKEGEITDYGNYSSIKNLTNTQKLDYNNQMVSADVPTGRFYYQGTLKDTSLPWNIKVIYSLSGKQIAADQLAGSKGELDINLLTSKNESLAATFYEHYLLQISITLNAEICKNIKAEGATIANSGKNQILTYTVMPGSEGDFNIKANVTDFEMESITISAVPFTSNIEIPDTSDMSSKFSSLAQAISQLNEGVSDLKEGINGLSTGAVSIEDGSSKFKTGMETLNASSDELKAASKKIKDALDYVYTNLQRKEGKLDFTALEQLPKALLQLAEGLGQISEGLKQLGNAYAEALQALDSSIAMIPDTAISEEDMKELMLNNPNNKALELLLSNYKAAQTVKATYSMVSDAFLAVKTQLPVFAASLDTMIDTLKASENNLKSSLQETDMTASISELAEGIHSLADNYKEFDSGLKDYADGISQLSRMYSKLDGGIKSLTNGTKELSQGTEELADGTSQLNHETGKLPEQIDFTIEELLDQYDNSDFNPVSFLSENNKKVSIVQFVMKTESIEMKKVEKPDTSEQEPETFWSRLMNLFEF